MGIPICPDCNNPMEVEGKHNDGSGYDCTCRNCVKFWSLKRTTPTEEELRELVQTP